MVEGTGPLVLVTGGHGFLGSHVVETLLERGYRVRCLVRPGRPSDLFGDQPVSIVRGDLRSPEGLAAAVAGADFVIHVAGLIAARGPGHFRSVNVDGTRRLAEAVRAAAPGCLRFVHVSSQAAAGPSLDGEPIGEERPPRPLTHYGRSKLAGEQVLPAALGGVAFSIVRPPAIYGSRDEAILPFFQLAARGFCPGLDGPGRRFNLLHARDVADGILAAATAPGADGRTYFLADDDGGYSYSGLGQAMATAYGRRQRRLPLPDVLLDLAAVAADEIAALTGRVSVFGRQKAIELKTRWWLCSPARARRELGWKARVPLATGLAETARWYAEAGKAPFPRASSL